MFVRVSIGNLAPIVAVPSCDEDSHYAVGILNSGSYAKGKKLLQPIGGAAKLTSRGRKLLEDKFGAKDFHKDDARFLVDDQHLEEVLSLFSVRDPDFFEIDPLREVWEELTLSEFPSNEHFPAIPPILSVGQVSDIEVVFRNTVRQPFKDEAGTSPLAGKEPSRRLFHLFEIRIPVREVFRYMVTSPAIRILSTTELETVQGGLSKGETIDGITIADNFILPRW